MSAADPSPFDEALRVDDGRPGGAEQAFALYRRAADQGVVQAEFNVAVMLDSGRGTLPDVVQASTWYARAAAHGDRRAAYNLGQLYEGGEGVPRNIELARAWYSASGLAAARSRMERLAPQNTGDDPPKPPKLIYPIGKDRPSNAASGIELVWVEQGQSRTTQFFVELRDLQPSGPHEVFSAFCETSSLFIPLQISSDRYAWRVYAVDQRVHAYEASSWAVVDSER